MRRTPFPRSVNALCFALLPVLSAALIAAPGSDPAAAHGSRTLRSAGLLSTGRQPKSVAPSPDGSLLCVPLLDDSGIDIFSSAPLAGIRRIAPPEIYARRLGFVEAVWLAKRSELWVSQMTTGTVHIFDARSLEYRETLDIEGEWPKVLIADADEERVYVSNWLSRDISVIDVSSRRVLTRIPVGGVPRGMALDLDERRLYTALFDSGDIAVVDLASRRVERRISGAGGAMRHVLRSPGTDTFYASDMFHGTVHRFDGEATEIGEPLRLGPNINTIALSPDGRLLYASSRGPNNPDDYTRRGPEPGKLFIIDCESWLVEDWVVGGYQPTGLAVGRRGDYVFFTDFLDDRLEIYRRRRDETSDKNLPER